MLSPKKKDSPLNPLLLLCGRPRTTTTVLAASGISSPCPPPPPPCEPEAGRHRPCPCPAPVEKGEGNGRAGPGSNRFAVCGLPDDEPQSRLGVLTVSSSGRRDDYSGCERFSVDPALVRSLGSASKQMPFASLSAGST